MLDQRSKRRMCFGKQNLLVLGILAIGLSSRGPAQPAINRESIPADLDPQVEVQIRRLLSRRPYLRIEAARALGTIGEASYPAIPFLVSLVPDAAICENLAIPGEDVLTVGHEAALAIARIGGAEAKAGFRQLLNNPQLHVRLRAASALGEMIDSDATVLLISALEDADSQVRREAVRSLCRRRDQRATPYLIDLLRRESAVLKNSGEGDFLAMNDARGGLPLKRECHSLRLCTAFALSELGDPAAVEPLIESFKFDADVVQRAILREALRLDTKRTAKIFQVALQDVDALMRKFAFVALESSVIRTEVGATTDQTLTAMLIPGIQDSDAMVRSQSVRTTNGLVSEIKEQSARSSIMHALIDAAVGDPEVAVRREGLLGLGQIDNEHCVKILLAAVFYDRPSLQRTALEALNLINNRSRTEGMVEAVRHPSMEIRLAATTLLKRKKDDYALELLIADLDDFDGRERGYVDASLRIITDQGFSSSEEWRTWFKQRRSSAREPK